MRRFTTFYVFHLLPTPCVSALVMLCFVPAVYAQQPYSIVHYDETRLPQTSIGSIQQDNNNYLWMNSQYGIVRFDGTGIRTFNMDNLKALTSNRIRLCAKGADGAIYFVDENYTILKVTAPATFETVITNADIQQHVLALFDMNPNSDLMLLPMNKTFNYNRFAADLQLDKLRGLTAMFATGTNNGCLFYVDLNGKQRVCYVKGTSYTPQLLADSFRMRHTFKLNSNIFWQSSTSEGWLLHEGMPMQKVKIAGLPSAYTSLFRLNERVIFCNATGTYLYASGNLYQYHFRDGMIVATPLFSGLPCSGVTDVMKEKTTGDFLISTRSEGFYQVKAKRFGVINLTLPEKDHAEQHLKVNDNIVYALQFWDNKHLFAYCHITPIYDSGFVQPLPALDYANFNLFFLYKPDSTHIWIDNKGKLQSINTKTGEATSMFPVFNARKVIKLSNNTYILLALQQILSIHHGTAATLYANDTLGFTTLERLSDDRFVVGTQNGLFYLYPAQKKLQPVPYTTTLKVRSLLHDRNGRIWFTTYGQGLFYLQGNRIVSLPMDNNRYLAISHSIVQDGTGDIWVSTNHGLFKIKYASLLEIISKKSTKLYYTYFDKTDGFNTNEFNGGCSPSGIYQAETGWMFFPTMDGIVKFQPDSIKGVSSNTPIYFDEVIYNDTGHLYVLNKPVQFDKHTSSIRILFSSPYFGNSANIKYAYALSTAPDSWKEVDNNGFIALNNLPGGSYTLYIKKEEAASKPVITRFSFEVEKGFTETIGFKLLVLSGVIGLVFLYFKARLLYLQNERARLEREVAERTAEQVHLIGNLKTTVTELKQVQQELSQMIEHRENIMGVLIHDIKSPLRFLNTVAAHLAATLQQNKPLKNKEIAGEMASSLNKLYLFVQDFALWLSASTPGRLQQHEKADLQKLVIDITAVFSEVAAGKGIVIQTLLNASTVYGDGAMIKSLLRNLLDNAVKNMRDGSIVISAANTSNPNECEIVIRDEGKGLQQEQVDELNRYFASEQEELSFSSERSGHKIIKDFLHKLNGRIRYEQNYPHGLVVKVILPAASSSSYTSNTSEVPLSNSN